MSNDKSMYTTNELADLLGMRPQSLINRRYRGVPPKFVRLGDGPKAAIRYRVEDVQDFLKENDK